LEGTIIVANLQPDDPFVDTKKCRPGIEITCPEIDKGKCVQFTLVSRAEKESSKWSFLRKPKDNGMLDKWDGCETQDYVENFLEKRLKEKCNMQNKDNQF